MVIYHWVSSGSVNEMKAQRNSEMKKKMSNKKKGISHLTLKSFLYKGFIDKLILDSHILGWRCHSNWLYAHITYPFVCLAALIPERVKPSNFVHHCKHDRAIIMVYRFFFGWFHSKFSKMAIFCCRKRSGCDWKLKIQIRIRIECPPASFRKCLHFNLSTGIYTNAYLYIVYVYNVLLIQQYKYFFFLAIKSNMESAIQRISLIST